MENQDEDEQKFVEAETSILEDLKREIAELEERVKELLRERGLTNEKTNTNTMRCFACWL